MRRTLVVVAGIAAVLVVAAVAVYVVGFGGDDNGAQKASQRYLDAWQRGDYATMQSLVDRPPADFATRYSGLKTDLGVTSWRFKRVSTGPHTTLFNASYDLGGGKAWGYDGRFELAKKGGTWKVLWSPAVIYPELVEGQRLRVARTWPERAAVVAADGSRLDASPSGSVQQLAGPVGPATAADVKRLGPPYQLGDPVGADGLNKQYERRLAGDPALTVQIVDAQKHVVKTLQRFGGKPGTALQTTLDPKTQKAAGQALANVTKPVSLVAVRPSTGEILAVANKPGGYNRALLGLYPPGSTFKVITASALVAQGISADSSVGCPPTTTVGGRTFHNYHHEDFGSVTLRLAFAHSCNTTFARLSVDKLGVDRLTQVATSFGFGSPLITGLPAARASFPKPADTTELAADSFGQGQVLASPLSMASVSGAIAAGTWHSPRLVSAADAAQAADAGGKAPAAPRALEPQVVQALRTLMPAVVSEGTAAGIDFPSGTAGKTGTAEYGSGDNPPTHAWFIGYRGDLAFAVLVEGGGTGAEAAAPLASTFLKGL